LRRARHSSGLTVRGVMPAAGGVCEGGGGIEVTGGCEGEGRCGAGVAAGPGSLAAGIADGWDCSPGVPLTVAK